MQSHRMYTVLTICWLFVLFNIERMVPAVNLASFVYVLATVAGVSMLLVKRLRDVSFSLTFGGFVLTMVVGKLILGYEVTWWSFPITLAEAVAIGVTQYLSRRIALDTDEFSESTTELLRLFRGHEIPSTVSQEPVMLREMDRARRTGRPVTVVSLRPLAASLSQNLQRWLAKLEAELVQKAGLAEFADVLARETKGSDIVSQNGREFVLLLPETDRQQAEALIERLSERAARKFDLALQARLSAFPEEEITLEGLMERCQESSAETFSEGRGATMAVSSAS